MVFVYKLVSGAEELKDECFLASTRGCTIQLLKFADAVAIRKHILDEADRWCSKESTRRGRCPLTGGFAAKWHRRINSYDSGSSEPSGSAAKWHHI
ncbi:hypothetical protein M5K25_022341 [Dendrobium thyrsiflorum]|uniref:Uncharacterized protein n=1 Tax=Dendrobium thyrsiflorum TaxID=117978 RepID=A0ABD0U641_DENTH